MSHVLLVGFMGAGKTTVARIAAGLLGRQMIDLDDVAESIAGRPINEIFATQGEPAFRALESTALESLGDVPSSVVATGGGVVLDPANRALLKRLGLVVYLEVSADEVLARIGDTDSRPLLQSADGSKAVAQMLESRLPLYEEVADVRISTTGLGSSMVAQQVVEAVRGRSE